MSRAFRGSPRIKAALLNRIDRHIADETLIVGPTTWDGTAGSPLGISVKATDPGVYARRFGYPLSLAGLLDPLTAMVPDQRAAVGVAREWAEAATPGADLGTVPTRLMLTLIDTAGAGSISDSERKLVDLHRRALDGETIARATWSKARTAIMAAADAAEGGRQQTVLEFLEAACWPAERGRSTLLTTIRAWLRLAESDLHPEWSIEKEAAAQRILQQIWRDHETDRTAGRVVPYIQLFSQRDRELAAGFETNLQHVNAAHLSLLDDLVSFVLHAIKSAC